MRPDNSKGNQWVDLEVVTAMDDKILSEIQEVLVTFLMLIK